MLIDRQQNRLFELSGEILTAFQDVTARVVHRPGETLFHQGERLSNVTFIDEGLCKLVWRTPDGRQALVGLRSKGWPVGSAYGLLERAQPFAAESLGRCAARQIPVRCFVSRLDDHPRLMRALLHLHDLKLDQAQKFHLLAMASLRARTRVEMLLSWLHDANIAVRHESQWVPTVDALSQRDMADLLAMTPETLTRVLKQLEAEGIVEKRNGWITLLEREGRRSAAQRIEEAC